VPAKRTASSPLQFGGVVPSLALSAHLGPPRSELGIGGLMPWCGRLYAVTYVSHRRRSGTGAGLYYIDEDFALHKCPESEDGTYTNRLVHHETNLCIIGPHVIDPGHRIRTVKELTEVRICATMRHLEDPANKVYMLGMEGEFFELDLRTLAAKKLFDLTQVLGTPGEGRVHFKNGYTAFGRVVIADNTYDEKDFSGAAEDGRLAEWDGSEWRILERKPFTEVSGRGVFGGTIFATGWDRASAILKVFTNADRTWRTYRLPKASHTFDHMWQTEWPRIRETEHERLLMDCHGLWYELSPWAYGNRVWGVRPISTHLWVHGDFCSWKGLLVVGADNASPSGGANALAAEPQSGFWFGKTDDLWRLGKPAGWGGPWWKSPVEACTPSDPYLMTGFEHKCVHLMHDSDRPVNFTIEVDFLGDGTWKTLTSRSVASGAYEHYVFEPGFGAHWVRFSVDRACRATAYLTYG
jgi:hypothetical protein